MALSQEEVDITCPYCGETIAILVDSSSGSQQYYEDCSVCCAPILFSIGINLEDELVLVDVKRDDEI
jgi:hypothetical protein